MTQIFSLWSFNDKVLRHQQQQKKAQLVDGVGSYFKLNILRLEQNSVPFFLFPIQAV